MENSWFRFLMSWTGYFLPIFFFVATFSCEWWLWKTDDVTTMIIHYIYYTATWETYNAEEMIRASSNFNWNTYEEFIIMNKWMMMTYWRKILWRSEDTNPVKKYCWWRFFPRKILLRPRSCYKLKEIFMDKKFLLQITGCAF